jgi:nucleoside-diphosphate-sugar epimerase
MVADLRIAVTGGTGFVGSRLLAALRQGGYQVRALTRRHQADGDGLSWIAGSLEDTESLARLAKGADALIHVAGVINADEAGFEAGNVRGTAALLDAARAQGVRRFVHVSSLAAREPELSSYGASKARSEALVRESGLDFAIVRPPAVYGPGDRETLALFRMARRGLILLPPEGRLSLIHADDLAALLVALVAAKNPPALIEPDDGKPGGWTHRELAAALGEAVGRRGIALSMSPAAMRLGALLDRLVRRDHARLTPDRAAYFCHPDWVADPSLAPSPDMWKPAIDTREGLRATTEWYSAHRLLRAPGRSSGAGMRT